MVALWGVEELEFGPWFVGGKADVRLVNGLSMMATAFSLLPRPSGCHWKTVEI
jgi:hypothetical protein